MSWYTLNHYKQLIIKYYKYTDDIQLLMYNTEKYIKE